jgi:ribose 5-phosphate isomerase B
MRVAFGADHAGFALKEHLRALVAADGHEVIDLGAYSTDSVDYPDRGIVVCGSGNGIAIAANKIDGVRCAVVRDVTSARLAVEHNDANVCSLGARFVGEQVAEDAVRAYLAAEFEGGRHARRVEKITDIERSGAD